MRQHANMIVIWVVIVSIVVSATQPHGSCCKVVYPAAGAMGLGCVIIIAIGIVNFCRNDRFQIFEKEERIYKQEEDSGSVTLHSVSSILASEEQEGESVEAPDIVKVDQHPETTFTCTIQMPDLDKVDLVPDTAHETRTDEQL